MTDHCQYCGKPLKQLYPEARYELQWSHTTRADAAACPSRTDRTRTNGWPIPAEPTS